MTTRLLVIENNLDSLELICLIQDLDDQICCERKTWDNLEPEALLRSHAQLILANVAPKTEKSVSFFHWMRRSPFPIPTVAILPESADRKLLGIVSEVADDFILQPMHAQELALRIARILAPESCVRHQHALKNPEGVPHLVGEHPLFLQAVEQVPLFASCDAPVLITGETGTGKEMFARAIHSLSTRQNGPFIPVDCGGLPESLAENELFGRCRGALGEEHTDQKGLAAMAEGGTLFFDEVDGLSLIGQSKLLRFLEDGTYRSLGSDRFIRADARVITATNQCIEDIVRQRQFRSDLYFRMNVLRLHLPTLRERPTDVPVLAKHFLEMECRRNSVRKVFSFTALRRLEEHHWPGNIRELLNTIRRAFLCCQGTQISPKHISLSINIDQPHPFGEEFSICQAACHRDI